INTPAQEAQPEVLKIEETVVETIEPESVTVSEEKIVTSNESHTTEPPIDDDTNEDNEEENLQEIANMPMKVELKLPDLNEAPTEDTLNFEPMHMVDYFASQGIKLSEEEQTDKLGRQLKSFTEWLKTMKKLPAYDSGQPGMATGKAGEQADLTIQALAEKSNKEGDVITEPMAEVLVRQGKLGRALEMYQKLSLMNPSKSAYFAAKIEQLKDS
ncbi:MAG TPA: hypothetical protein VKH37_02565, partial [Ferruginibacter sp.]|nr:hypothetical protein [Ferruginibacter sp.]